MNTEQKSHRRDAETQSKEVLYFGCWGTPGHYLYRNNGRIEWRMENTPWGNSIDGGLLQAAHVPDIPNGDTVVAHKGGWTAIAFWDRTGDHRGASNSAFLINAHVTGEELLELARTFFPALFSRFSAPLRLCGSKS